MHTVNFFRGSVDISDEIYIARKSESSSTDDLELTLKKYAILDFRYVQAAIANLGLDIPQTMRMLEAHGGKTENEYMFADLKDESEELVWTPVESWVEKHSELYDILYISVCNPHGLVLPQSNSMLIYPNSKFQGVEIVRLANGVDNGVFNVTLPLAHEFKSSSNI